MWTNMEEEIDGLLKRAVKTHEQNIIIFIKWGFAFLETSFLLGFLGMIHIFI